MCTFPVLSVLLFHTPRAGSCLSFRFRASHLPSDLPRSVCARMTIVHALAPALNVPWHLCLCLSGGMVLVAIEGPRAREHGSASKVSLGNLGRIRTVTLWHACFGVKSTSDAEVGRLGTRVPRNARSVLGDHSFGSNDADFVLFGVMTEEIRWLRYGVVVPRVTPPSTRRRRHLRLARREHSFTSSPLWSPGSVACAHVVLWTFTEISRLWWALAQEG